MKGFPALSCDGQTRLNTCPRELKLIEPLTRDSGSPSLNPCLVGNYFFIEIELNVLLFFVLPSVSFYFKMTFLYSPADRPEAPYNLSVISYTWESVYVGWTPGFNGGETQSFFIHFTSSVPPIYTGEITVSPPAATLFNITGKSGGFCIFFFSKTMFQHLYLLSLLLLHLKKKRKVMGFDSF